MTDDSDIHNMVPKKVVMKLGNTENGDCDRCGGNHQSEQCPYYSKPKQSTHQSNSSPLQVLNTFKQREQNEKMKKYVNILRWVFGIVTVFLMVIYIMCAAFGTKQANELMDSDEFGICMDMNSTINIAASRPSKGETLFTMVIMVTMLVMIAFEGTLYCLMSKLCSEKTRKIFSMIVAVLILISMFISIGIIVHFFNYFNELRDKIDCVDDINGWNLMWQNITLSFVTQWIWILFLIITPIFHCWYKRLQ